MPENTARLTQDEALDLAYNLSHMVAIDHVEAAIEDGDDDDVEDALEVLRAVRRGEYLLTWGIYYRMTDEDNDEDNDKDDAFSGMAPYEATLAWFMEPSVQERLLATYR